MPFTREDTEIKGVFIIKPVAFPDERGMFLETYKFSEYAKLGINHQFVQDNLSVSRKGTLRGLHFQDPPHAQGKLVRVVKGEILDVAVDIRIGSPSFGKYVSAVLSENNFLQLWVPPGFAHGFIARKDSIVEYKVTGEYYRESENGIIWNDETVNVQWGTEKHFLSEKDKKWKKLSAVNSKFAYGEY